MKPSKAGNVDLDYFNALRSIGQAPVEDIAMICHVEEVTACTAQWRPAPSSLSRVDGDSGACLKVVSLRGPLPISHILPMIVRMIELDESRSCISVYLSGIRTMIDGF